MARQGLPAKYAKMGFKKGWAAFRSAKRGRSMGHSHKTSHKKTHTKHHPVTVFQLSGPAKIGGNSVKISKSRLQELADKARRAMAKVREMKTTDAAEAGIAIAEGAAGAVGSSWLLGMIPVPANLPRPGAWKAVAQIAVGVGAATLAKSKHIRYPGYGAAIIGAIGLAREFYPLPALAGEVDTFMYGGGGPLEGGPLEGANNSRGNEETPAYMGGNSNPYGD